MGKYGKENKYTEFERILTPKSLEKVVGFLNSEGGQILFGVDNDGEPCNNLDLNQLELQVTNALQDVRAPDPSVYLNISRENDEIVKLTIDKGQNKPYFLKAKGLNSKGVFLRKRSENYRASEEEISAMIRDSDGDKFEEARSLVQELTFNEAKKFFNEKDIEFLNQFETLGLVQLETGLYTNLALLLLDQNHFSFKVATFRDPYKTEFIAREEFFGSVLKQIEDVLNFIKLVNMHSFKIKRQYRVEKSDYPESSIREVVINSIIHRDYDFGGSTFIKINDIDMEVTSFGNLFKDLQLDDLTNSISKLRNPKLADIFYQLELIEANGTGIIKIMSDYSDETIKPKINVTPNTFQIRLPNRNTKII